MSDENTGRSGRTAAGTRNAPDRTAERREGSTGGRGPERNSPPRAAPPRGLGRMLGVAMVIILAFGLLFSFLNPATFDPPAASLEQVLSGDWMAEYQAAYERELPIREWAVNAWAVLQYAVFREGRPGVLVGAEGWLFTTEEFDHHPDTDRVMAENAERVSEIGQRLQADGIELVVALVPAKARVYPEYLGRYRMPGELAERYTRFRAELRERGITAPNLEARLQEAKAREQLFLRTDTHWTPAGARVAAAALSERVKPVLERRDAPRRRFELTPEDERTYAGDLTRFLPVVPFRGRIGAERDQVTEYRLEETDPPEIGLFDEVPHPVALVGTSYSAGEVWAFEDWLRVGLQTEVMNAAEQGRGPFLPMERYLESDTYRDVPPEVVIWEIPERYVTDPPPERAGPGS